MLNAYFTYEIGSKKKNIFTVNKKLVFSYRFKKAKSCMT